MSALCMSPIGFSLLVLVSTHAQAETIGDARVGFTAERVLILDGRIFVGRMWAMPGEQRHEQEFPALKPVFILRADKPVGEVVLPQLHTVVEFALPSAAAILSHPDLRRRIGQESIDGITTTQYLVENIWWRTIRPKAVRRALLLSRDGIPMKCVGKFETRNGKLSTIDWQLHHVQIGRQAAALFEVPRSYTKLPLEAAAPLLGMRIAPAPTR